MVSTQDVYLKCSMWQQERGALLLFKKSQVTKKKISEKSHNYIKSAPKGAKPSTTSFDKKPYARKELLFRYASREKANVRPLSAEGLKMS